MKEENEGRPMGQVIKIDEARIRDHLGEMVRGTVEETLNAMLDAEADEEVGECGLRSGHCGSRAHSTDGNGGREPAPNRDHCLP